MDEMINERVTQKENEMHATYDEKIRNFEERLIVLFGKDVFTDVTEPRQGTRSSAAGNSYTDTTQGTSGVKRIQPCEAARSHPKTR